MKFVFKIYLTMILIAGIMWLLTGCGSDPQSTKEPAQDVPRETIQYQQKSFALESIDELPACDQQTQNWLVFVSSESQFFSCRNEEWFAIDIDGKNGKDGIDGIAGNDGADGRDGKDGVDGVNGADTSQFWRDPITDKIWFKAGQTYGSTLKATCIPSQAPYGGGVEGTFRWPTHDEVIGAVNHGIYDGYRVRIGMADNKYLMTDRPEELINANSVTGLIICIYQESAPEPN